MLVGVKKKAPITTRKWEAGLDDLGTGTPWPKHRTRRADFPKPGVGMVSVATALAVLPTNRPRAGSKLTDHSSDTES